jgi:predicted DNA-binding transcriptional regulator YafY
MSDVQIAFEKEWDRTHGIAPTPFNFTVPQLSALLAALSALESSERSTRSAAVQLIALGEKDGAEVTERLANEKLHHIGVLKQMAGIESTQHPMPQFPETRE